MRHLLLGLAVGLLMVGSAWADGTEDRGEGYHALFIGANGLDLDKTSDTFEERGLPRLDDAIFFMGGCCYTFVRDRLMLGGSGSVFWQEVEGDDPTPK